VKVIRGNEMDFLTRLHNPVAEREFIYQRRAVGLLRSSRLQWAYRVFYYPALALALLVFLSEFGAALQPNEDRSAALALNVIVIFALVVAILMHLYLLLQTLVRAATSIAREKQAGTWENLLMTGTDARRLVMGKWWGTLQGLIGGFALLIPLRAGVVVWLGAVFDRTQVLSIESVSDFIAPSSFAFFSTFPIIALFTFGGALLVAAVGVLASTLSRTLVEALILAFILMALVFGGMFGLLGFAHHITSRDEMISTEWRDVVAPYSENTLISWVDNGISLTSELVNYRTQYENLSPQRVANYYDSRKTEAWALSLITCVGLYAVLTWTMLRAARAVVLRQGALPPGKRQF
jgi:hypothetical protein